MRWSSIVFLAPAAALATVWGCGGGDPTSGTGTSSGGGAGTTATSGTGGAATTTSGTGGSATATSTGQGGGSTSASTGSSSAGSSGTGSNACVWAAVNPCGPGMYCDAPGCQQGTCVPTGGVETADKSPVCGCDDVTYWNGSVAKTHGQSVSKASACKPGKSCGGFGGIQCPGKATCAYQFDDSTLCNAADIGGNCWTTPAVCPPIVVGSKTRACGTGKCDDECSLIKSSTSYYTDSTCPQ